MNNSSLANFLEYKSLYYDKIDFSYVNKAYEILKEKIKLPYVIHIVGTNGKGSTGRFLSQYLIKKSFKTLHYSSPHILKFNERIWLNGADVSDELLEEAHDFLKNIYNQELLEKLTYFEYTTILAFYLSKDMDYLVLEAGLGGEFDATNVCENNLSLITTIDLDHQDFLGNCVEDIAKTKMRSVDNTMIIGYQIHDEIYKVAQEVKKQKLKEEKKDIKILQVEDFQKYEFSNVSAHYLKRNLHLVVKCLEFLDIQIDLKLFDDVKLLGRCERIAKNITIDVGHNPLAATVLKDEFKNKKIVLIYNSYKDKDYEKVLNILKPIIKKINIIKLDDSRIVEKSKLLKVTKELKIPLEERLHIIDSEEYLAFGSFLVVEKFLKILDYDRA